MSKSYMNPEIDADSHGSPMDQAIRQHQETVKSDNAKIAQSSGKTTGGGRTLNIPKSLPPNVLPGPSYNGAVTAGPPCQGGHCSIPVTPTGANLIHHNLKSSNPPPGATTNYPGTNRMGNNTISMPGINQYDGTRVNPGPFHIQCGAGDSQNPLDLIYDPRSRCNVDLFSRRGRKVLWRYLRNLD